MTRFRSPVKKPHPIEMVELIPSGGGIFDVHADEELIYSKFETGRHAEHGEVLASIDHKLRQLG